MIDIKTDIDHLDGLAAQYLADGLEETGKDIRGAAADIKNLRDHCITLEQQNAQVLHDNALADASAGRLLLNDLQQLIDARIDLKLEEFNPRDAVPHIESVREILKELINGGDVCVDVDYSNVELELTLSV